MTNEDKLAQIKERLRQFVLDRDWSRFHNAKNLAMAIASEAGELLAEFRWVGDTEADDVASNVDGRERIEHEVADIAIVLFLFCERLNIDLLDAVSRKIAVNEHNYPVSLAKGKAQRPNQESKMMVHPQYD